ncbi:hypothetical protein [Arthrobacter sp. NicSoilC5]|uniref:hypothetical protein n=1 Tax=Arthrobacter sp. NicSoilC5 TaxID=2831000 RepID=UPI001CC7D271|nr:hypothetical protein [Arthrobacter sp. NicSoilC5]BCW78866.1 hypothetical protein NicSoilC5_08850 [Arthrobacter sp. NicSoilC5]
MKRITGAVLAVVFVVGLAAFFIIRTAEDRVTADMVSRAGRFGIPADWKLAQEIVRPERFMCISTNPCPSLYRRWEAGRELTDQDVLAVASGLRGPMTSDHPCKRPPNVSGTITICASRGTDGEYNYHLTVTSPGLQEPQLVTLIIRPVQ